MMNGAALSLSAKRHTLTASSTCHDEIIEFSIAVNRIIGFRNIMCEMGLEQSDATTIYQDNEAAIHLAMNRERFPSNPGTLIERFWQHETRLKIMR